MNTIKQSDLTFHRAGSDYVGFAWSAHVTGFDFKRGERYLIERPDGSTHEVGVVGKNRIDGVSAHHIVEADALHAYGY